MEKRLLHVLMLVLLLVAGSTVKANPVDRNLAREVGAKFIKVNTPLKSATENDMQWVTTYRTSNDVAAFHVFNTPKGFVIVAADDCAHPILGYSEESHFDINNIPVQMQAYLSGFVEQMEYGIEHRVADPEIAREWQLVRTLGKLHENRATTAVSPLVATHWNQNCYYNNLCPDDADGPCEHVYAGCVATAMAQIMKYWGYPSVGTGSHTYTPSGYPAQTANFGATSYNWPNMPNSISASSTSTQLNAVATLIWHCGVSVDMMYAPTGSGAYSNDVPYALRNYFGYSDDMYYTSRGDDDAAWLAQVKACLDLGRPVYYSATDTQGYGGHAFVCDGYDANDMLHFNWGWSGNGDNYFALNALNVNIYQFNSGHAAIFDIHPSCAPGTTYQVSITANPSDGGTVTGAGSYACGAGCTVTATPAEGYMFSAWTENGVLVTTDPTYSFTVMGSRSLVANFCPSLTDPCTIVFHLFDSYGDGWNGNQLTVSYSDGCISNEQLTIDAGGSEAIFTRNVVDGSYITLGWIMGQWASECSFTVTYEDGSIIYEGSNLSASFSYGFVVSCGGTPPVADYLTYSINSDGVSVTVTGHVDGMSATGALVIPSTTTIDGVTYAVTAIASGAFQHAEGITSVTFGNAVTSIGSAAFWGCIGLEAVYFTGSVANWCGINFADYDANPLSYAEDFYIGGSFVSNLVIPEGVTNIRKFAFTHSPITTVSFPSTLNIIGMAAFSYCHNLTSILLPAAVYSLQGYVFSECSQLEQIAVEAGNTNFDSRNNCNAIIDS